MSLSQYTENEKSDRIFKNVKKLRKILKKVSPLKITDHTKSCVQSFFSINGTSTKKD